MIRDFSEFLRAWQKFVAAQQRCRPQSQDLTGLYNITPVWLMTGEGRALSGSFDLHGQEHELGGQDFDESMV